MAVDDSEDSFGQQLVFGVLALVGIGLVYLVGMDAYLNQVSPWVLSSAQLYSVAFALGVWATMTAVFLANYLSKQFVDEASIAFKPPEE